MLPAVAPVDHVATEPASETKSDRKYWTIRINRTAANWAAAGAICFLCLLPISSDSNPDRYSAGFVPYGWLDEASVVTPEQKQAKPSIALAPKAETQEEIVSTTPEHAASSSLVISHDEALLQGSHAVVVGVFKGPKRAEQFIEEAAADQTQAEGISLQIIQESSRCLVIAGISSSEERAGELRRSVSALSDSFAGAWIYAL